MNYFSALLDLLKTEREEDRKQYQQLISSSSTGDRRAAGLTWYPVAVRDTEMGRGDYLTVELERTTHQDVPHQLRFGVSAMLFSNHDPKEDAVEGVVTWQSGNRLKLTLKTDELPEWSRNGKLGVDLLFDDNSYDEMQNALKQAAAILDKKEGHLAQVLTGAKAPTFNDALPPVAVPGLNPSQQAAVNRILAANDLAIVHGPPGTGKTTTLVQAIKALLREEKQVLVVAPSNAAVDLLSEKLAAEGLNVLRVGNPARVSEQLMSLTLDAKMSAHPAMKDIRRLKKQASEFRDMAHKYKRNFGKAERDQRKALFDEARNIMKNVESTEQYITEDLMAKAQVVTATLVGANHYTVRNLRYRTVVIDEAGQALEPACWIPVLKAEKVVLAGDHCQLSPTVKSAEAARNGLSTTLLEKMAGLYPPAVALLEEQYRMHEMIMGYSAAVFYGNRLTAHASVAGHLLHPGDTPLAFVDTAGCGFDETTEGTSTTNPEEAAFLFKHLLQLVNELQPHYRPENFPGIAIISPYRQQIALLNEQLDHAAALQPYRHKISVNTIDSFQGQERDVVYISMTRSNPDSNIGFLADIRRMNVAMTRARKKLVVIGDSATLSRLPFYADFITYAEKQNAYRSAWEYADN
ncbi:IGHMBP2 family helicase [Chitinophaga alhagiae]|uniref:IGHMBP2 family helicase n=1 Tax=Chitinophaga alhagiae TaxID=2203219 RepID=A0ABN5LTW2_9BACT|nr:AAA domain-containing protein [Chitinophaga alhagiae]AWO00206.1 IGHMBP2 family helicase [Chitinophaga alhagiae]